MFVYLRRSLIFCESLPVLLKPPEASAESFLNPKSALGRKKLYV